MDYLKLRQLAQKLSKHKWYRNYCALYDQDFKLALQALTIHKFEEVQAGVSWYEGKPGPKVKQIEAFVFRHPKIPVCKVCGSEKVKFRIDLNKFAEYCSYGCAAKGSVEKREQTCMEKYGARNPSLVKSIKEKREATFQRKFGGNPYANKDVQKKIAVTNLTRYGVINPSSTKQVREKVKRTFKEKYGHEHWTQNKEHYQKVGNSFNDEMIKKSAETYERKTGFKNPMKNPEVQEKIKQTNLKRYGVDNPSKHKTIVEKIKQTFLRNYGTINPNELDVIKNKVRATKIERYGTESFISSKRIKKVVDKNSKEHLVAGFEDKAIRLISEMSKVISIQSKNIKPIDYYHEGKHHRYFPDLLIVTESGTHVVEVKSNYTLNMDFDKNLSKFKAATKHYKSQQVNFWVMVFGRGEDFDYVKNPTTRKQVSRLFGN